MSYGARLKEVQVCCAVNIQTLESNAAASGKVLAGPRCLVAAL